MGQALYRKYRSKSLDEVIGQEHVTTTLKNALKQGNLSHAYLFTGPRGVGKTSVARILAHIVNELDYDEGANHLDIIEIDAASNRRIDEIRELRERVHTAPAAARYKVYIIDEVHMLTREAFNALLKTLEEPPAHVIFILATTEAHKLPETIISRTQRFSFKPIDKDTAVKHLKTMAKTEKLDIDDEALELIAEHGAGSFRDSIGLLDQVRGLGKHVSTEDVQSLLGIPPYTIAEQILSALQAGDRKELLSQLNRLNEQGFLATQVAKQLAGVIRNGLIENDSILDTSVASELLRQLLEVPASHDPESLLEIILLTVPMRQPAESTPHKKVVRPEPAALDSPEKSASKVDETKAVPEPTATPTSKKKPGTDISQTSSQDEAWQETLQRLRKTHNTLYSIARMAQAHLEAEQLTLVLGFPFHQKRLNESKNKKVIIDIYSEVSGTDISLVCELDPNHKQPPENKPQIKTVENSPLDTISNIFGGGEVLE